MSGSSEASALATKTAMPRPKPPPASSPPDSTPKTVDCYAAMQPGEPMQPFSYELPSTTPPPGYVDVAITHCGVCHSDLHQIDNSWKVATFPLVPGHEIVGTIAAVAEDAQTRAKFAIGDRACIGVQRSNCGRCTMCEARLEQVCPEISKTYAGPGKDKGGFATLIRYPSDWVFRAPDGLSSEYLAPLMCAGITTYSPLKRLGKPGAKVGVIGIGGLGHVALQFASAMGFSEVVAISRSPNKEAEARGFGADTFLISDDEAAMAAAACSFDVILNTVSRTPTRALPQPATALQPPSTHRPPKRFTTPHSTQRSPNRHMSPTPLPTVPLSAHVRVRTTFSRYLVTHPLIRTWRFSSLAARSRALACQRRTRSRSSGSSRW